MASFTETYIDPIFLTVGTPVNKPLTGEHCKLLPPVEKYVMADKCISKDKQNVTMCGGNCPSSAEASAGTEPYDPTCNCCKPVSYERSNITVVCDGEKEMLADFYRITKCECNLLTCTATISHNLEKETDAETKTEIANDANKKRRRRALSRLFALPP